MGGLEILGGRQTKGGNLTIVQTLIKVFFFFFEKIEIALICTQKVTQSRISVFFAVFICFLDGTVRKVVFY